MSVDTSLPAAPSVGTRMAPTVDSADIGSLLCRVAVAIAFFVQATGVWGWFGGSGGIAGKKEFVDLLGYSAPALMAWVLLLLEFGIAISFAAGLLTPLGSAAAIGVCFNIICGFAWHRGVNGGAGGPGYLLNLVLALVALAVAFTGPGRYAFDRTLGVRLEGLRAGVASLFTGVIVGIFVLTVIGPGFGGAPIPTGP